MMATLAAALRFGEAGLEESGALTAAKRSGEAGYV